MRSLNVSNRIRRTLIRNVESKVSKANTGINGSGELRINYIYKEETVEAGTFMAYTIKYTGKTTNSRGYNADEEEVWLYAPAVKTFIKLTQSQGDFLYVEELIEYSKSE